MYLSELLRSAGRRWYVLVAGALLTLGCVILVLRFVPVGYDVKSSILLLPPQISVEESGNPFLGLGGLEVVAGVLTRSLTDTESEETVAPTEGTATYTVEKDLQVSGSVLEITASDVTEAGAFATLNAVVDLATDRLRALQNDAGAQPEAQVRLMVITDNTVAKPDIASLARVLIVVVAIGSVLTLLLAILVDAVVRRRIVISVDRARDELSLLPDLGTDPLRESLGDNRRRDDPLPKALEDAVSADASRGPVPTQRPTQGQ